MGLIELAEHKKWRLGLDLGTNSLGWAALSLSNDPHPKPNGLIDMGVRIFSDGRNPQDKQSNAATRRMPRGARRNRDRYIKRRSEFLELLTQYNLMPSDNIDRQKLEQLDPWVLRARALDEQITLHEFGRALFHLQQRRGFKSNRHTDKANDDTGKVDKGAKEAYTAMGVSGAESLGQLKGQPRLERQNENQNKPKGQRKAMPLARVRSHGEGFKLAYDYYPLREMIADEFDLLWDAQSKFHTALTQEAREALRDGLFFQRPLKPQPLGRCTLESEEERAPNALPSVQRLRIYQELNNLRISEGPGISRHPLTLAQRDNLAEKLEHVAKLSLKQIRKALTLTEAASFSIEEGKRDYLDGNKTHAIMTANSKNGGDWGEWANLPVAEQDALVEIMLGRVAPVKGSNVAVLKTHNVIVSSIAAALELHEETARELLESDKQDGFAEFLFERYALDDDTIDRILSLRLPDGYGRLSRTAGHKVLEMLIANDENSDLRTYDKAVKAAGYFSHSLLGTGEVFDKVLPYYGEVLERSVAFGTGNPNDEIEKRVGKIANPTVHVALNQLRHVVNALVARLGPPSEIVLELARDLPLSAKGKSELESKQKENRTQNEKRAEELAKFNEPNTYNNRMLMRLWDELGATAKLCPFTGKHLSKSMLFSDEIEIEHILPRSRTLDDSFSNKVLSLREANRRKGSLTPWEAVEAGIFDRETIEASLRDLPKNKAWRFGPDAMERFENEERDFLDRQLNDTRYISKLAKQFMDATGADTWVVNGRLTSDLRHIWGLNSALTGHNREPADNEAQDVKKNRNDHRHHAIDAFVVACTDRAMIKAAADAAQTMEKDFADGKRETRRLLEDIPNPFDNYLDAVKDCAAKIIISHKADHGIQGELHEGTNYGIVKTQDGGQRLASRKAIVGLSANEIKNIGDDRIKRELLELTKGLENKNKDKERKAVLLKYTQDTGHIRVRIHKKQEAFEQINHGPDSKGKSHMRAVIPGDNYCMDIVETPDGKWHGVAVTRFEAHKPEWKKKWQRSHPDGRLVMRVRNGDLIKLTHDGDEKVMRVVRISPSANIFYLVPHNEGGEFQKRHENDDDHFRWELGSISKYKERKARLVRITPDGQIIDPGPPK
jgi:CRISPR-associated endonuclease Csn1